MLGLLTWPAYGTWFARADRGWIDRDGGEAEAVPEPTRSHAQGRQRLVWPPVRLDERQQTVVIGDLARIASLRSFELLMVAAAPDHVHVLAHGRIIASGGKDLALRLEDEGYAPILKEAGFDTDALDEDPEIEHLEEQED